MICIAAFIIFAILGIFSAKYRAAAKKAWQCTARRLTFRPCDTSLKDDIKNRLLGKLILTKPRLARFLDRWIEVLAFVFVVLMIWSVFVVIKSGVNLYVYNTCNPAQAESCSLGAEACSANTGSPGFWDSLFDGRPDRWVTSEAKSFAEAVSLIPIKFRDWKATDYLGEAQSYYRTYDPNKPTALEIIDPGCQYCAKLWSNIKEAGFADRYNLTYIAYPIPDVTTGTNYKFQHSYLISSYLEAIKMTPLADSETPVDWQILNRLFTEKDDQNISWQTKFNGVLTKEKAEETLQAWLSEFGYSEEQVNQIKEAVDSDEIRNRLSRGKQIVEDKVHTVKIPTIIYDGERHDGVVETAKLK